MACSSTLSFTKSTIKYNLNHASRYQEGHVKMQSELTALKELQQTSPMLGHTQTSLSCHFLVMETRLRLRERRPTWRE